MSHGMFDKENVARAVIEEDEQNIEDLKVKILTAIKNENFETFHELFNTHPYFSEYRDNRFGSDAVAARTKKSTLQTAFARAWETLRDLSYLSATFVDVYNTGAVLGNTVGGFNLTQPNHWELFLSAKIPLALDTLTVLAGGEQRNSSAAKAFRFLNDSSGRYHFVQNNYNQNITNASNYIIEPAPVVE